MSARVTTPRPLLEMLFVVCGGYGLPSLDAAACRLLPKKSSASVEDSKTGEKDVEVEVEVAAVGDSEE